MPAYGFGFFDSFAHDFLHMIFDQVIIIKINILILIFKVVSFFFYHSKIHLLTSYNAIKNNSDKTRQHRTQNFHKTHSA